VKLLSNKGSARSGMKSASFTTRIKMHSILKVFKKAQNTVRLESGYLSHYSFQLSSSYEASLPTLSSASRHPK
jgi:hypothetical protein